MAGCVPTAYCMDKSKNFKYERWNVAGAVLCPGTDKKEELFEEKPVTQQYTKVHDQRFCSQNDGNYNSKLKHKGGEDYKRACFEHVMNDKDCGGKFFFMNWPKNTECACCKNTSDKLPAGEIRRTGNNNNIYRIGGSGPKKATPPPKQQYE